MRERDSADSGNLPPALRDAVRALRADDVAPTDIWRQRLLREVAAVPAPSRTASTRWSIRPVTAVAAGLVCALIGASAAIAVRRPPPAPASVAAVPASESVVRFTLVAPGAASVSLVGDFNGWSAGALPLRRSPDGRTWEVEIPLAPGRYAYSFMVDGRLARDPSAPQVRDEDLGTTNSVLMVRSGP